MFGCICNCKITGKMFHVAGVLVGICHWDCYRNACAEMQSASCETMDDTFTFSLSDILKFMLNKQSLKLQFFLNSLYKG